MKIFLLVAFILFNVNLHASYNLFGTSTQNVDVLFKSNVDISDFNSREDLDLKFDPNSSYQNFDISKIDLSGSSWSASEIKSTKDSQILIYLSSIDSDTITYRFLGLCLNVFKVKDDYDYRKFTNALGSKTWQTDLDDNYEMYCIWPQIQSQISVDTSSYLSVEALVFAFNNQELADAYFAFESACSANVIDCNYKTEFNLQLCSETYVKDTTDLEYLSIGGTYRQENDCSDQFGRSFLKDNITYTTKRADAIASSGDYECYLCFLKMTNQYVESSDLCLNLKKKAEDICSLQNLKLDTTTYSCSFDSETSSYDESEYKCKQVYDESSMLNGSYDTSTKEFTDSSGVVYDVDSQGRIVDKDGTQTGYHLTGNATDGYVVNKTTDAESIAKDLDALDDDISEAVEDAAKDCIERDPVTNECVEKEASLASETVSVFNGMYDKIRDTYGLTRFLGEIKQYDKDDAEFLLSLDLSSVNIPLTDIYLSKYTIISKDKLDDWLLENGALSYIRSMFAFLAYAMAIMLFIKNFK